MSNTITSKRCAQFRASGSQIALATIGILAFAGTAAAQDGAAQPESASDANDTAAIESGDVIVVTGSRVIEDGSRAPTPVTVVSSEQLALASPGPIGEALNQVPVFRGSNGATTGGVASTGPLSGSFLNLRNLGIQRTLVLLDGRRSTPSALSGATDTNLLPQELVKRVDVVTGGASAAYGSDAVSGVVNFILDTRFKGLKGRVQTGISDYGDNESIKASLTGGLSFDDDRGSFVVSGSYYDSKGVPSTFDRPWGAEGRNAFTDGDNPEQLLIATDVNSSLVSRGGLIAFSPQTITAPANLLRGIHFLPGGNPAAFDFGASTSASGQIGGDGARGESNLKAAVETASLFGHLRYAISPSVEVFAEASWASARNNYAQLQQFHTPGLNPVLIFNGNPFLPDSIQAQMSEHSIPFFMLGRLSFDLGGPTTAHAANDTISGVVGFTADLPGDWTLDGYYQHGENRQRIRTSNNIIHERFYAAADAVRAPDGSIVCRVTLTHPDLYPGCVPINLFGEGSPSREAADYVLGTSSYRTVLKQDVAALAIRGKPFSTWAGPVAISTGVEYRRNSSVQTSDPISQQTNLATGILGFPNVYRLAPGGYQYTNAQPVSGSYDIREGFFEFLAPLANTLELNGAIRYADYSTSGGVTTWKVGGSWEALDGVRIRATRSRDIRAPNIAELFSGSVQSQTVVSDPERPGERPGVVVSSLGNPDLDPEKADTLTAGVVIQPAFLPGLSLSADYYDIDLNGVISSLTAQQTVDQCAAGSAVACSNITRSDEGVITRILRPQLNLTSQQVRGIDFELGYHTVMGNGQLSVRALASHLIEQKILVPGGITDDRTGEVGISSNPSWSGTLNVNYSQGPWSLFVQERFIGAGKYDNARIDGVTINDNTVGSVFYTDATLTFRAGHERRPLEFSFSANNLFNRAPPNTPVAGVFGGFYPTNPQLYDPLGRYYSVAVKLSL